MGTHDLCTWILTSFGYPCTPDVIYTLRVSEKPDSCGSVYQHLQDVLIKSGLCMASDLVALYCASEASAKFLLDMLYCFPAGKT